MWTLWNKITSQKIAFENFMKWGLKGGISIYADSGPPGYVLWCCIRICHQLLTFIQIGSGHTVNQILICTNKESSKSTQNSGLKYVQIVQPNYLSYVAGKFDYFILLTKLVFSLTNLSFRNYKWKANYWFLIIKEEFLQKL